MPKRMYGWVSVDWLDDGLGGELLSPERNSSTIPRAAAKRGWITPHLPEHGDKGTSQNPGPPRGYFLVAVLGERKLSALNDEERREYRRWQEELPAKLGERALARSLYCEGHLRHVPPTQEELSELLAWQTVTRNRYSLA